MAYFPEYYGGEYWNRALTSVGQELGGSIAESMKFYRDRHEQMTQLDQTFDALHDMKGVDGKPVLDPKAWERIKAHTGTELYGLEKAYLSAMQIGSQVEKAHADLQKATQYLGGPRYLGTPPYAQQDPRTGLWHKMPTPPEGQEEKPEGTSPGGVPPGGVVQKESPWWQKATNELVKTLYGGQYTGPFKLQQEVRRAVPVGPTQQQGQQQGESQTVGLPPLRNNPDAKRIQAMYAAKKISKEEAIRMIRALGYTDAQM